MWLASTAAVIALGLLLTSCGSNQSGGSPSPSSTQADDPPPKADRCRGGKTRPLEIGTVIDVARRHGITLYDDPQCVPDPIVVSQAANIILYGPNTNLHRQREIERREGSVSCFLSAAPLFPRTVERIHYRDDEETHFRLLNTECVIYPDPAKADEQLAQVQQMMNELEQQRGQQR